MRKKVNYNIFPFRDTILEKIQQMEDISTETLDLMDEKDDWRNSFKNILI